MSCDWCLPIRHLPSSSCLSRTGLWDPNLAFAWFHKILLEPTMPIILYVGFFALLAELCSCYRACMAHRVECISCLTSHGKQLPTLLVWPLWSRSCKQALGGSIKAPSPFMLCTGQVVHWLLFRSTAFTSQSTTADLYFLLRLLSLWYCELGERKCEDQGSLLEQTGSRVPEQFLPRRQEWERNASSERLAFLCPILMPVAVGLPSVLLLSN